MNQPMVRAEGLRRRYGGADGYEAVRGVSFEAAAGEVFGLLGTNGAGKTSTLEVLMGLAAPSGGSVEVLGLDPFRDRRSVRPYTGSMLQSAGFPSALTVRETAKTWAGTLAVSLPVDETLERVQLTHRADVQVAVMSGGERRRLDLALALLGRPKVLFLDEPTTGLDPESRRNTWELIEHVRDDGTAVILTTHYLDEAERLADRLVIMDAGVVARRGTVEQIVAEHPAQIRFGAVPVPLPSLPDVVDVSTTGGSTAIRTRDLQSTLTALLRWAQAESIRLTGLHAAAASLESVFLSVADRGTDVVGDQEPSQPTPHEEFDHA